MRHFLVAVCSLFIALIPLRAVADPISDVGGGLSVTDRSDVNRDPTPGGKSPSKSQEQLDYEAAVRHNKAATQRYDQQNKAYEACVAAATGPCTAPDLPNIDPTLLQRPGSLPAISGEAAAYVAFARLRLTPPEPVIGPSPDLNRWKMAAVGYPLWLSVSGDISPPGVSDAVANVRVSLKARVNRVSFAMGDGHSVNCTDVTKQWSRAVEPGAKSPACGYTYTKPSLPTGRYTVTATTYWSVAWSTSSESGVIDHAQQSSIQVPVGELQVLVR